MALSNDLISQFVKATQKKKTDKVETTVYGTIVAYDGSKYMRIDGSDLLTPIETTTDVIAGERVTALIKNHSLVVTGNVSSPSARTGDVTELGNTLTASSADIADLKANTLRADVAELQYATIKDLDATNGRIDTLESTWGTFKKVTADKIEAMEASIIELETGGISTETLDARYAKIVDLDTEKARITSLETGVADIDTLIFGSATGTTIQTSFSNSVIAQLGDAQIKSAMIESIAASKITSGDIITKNIRVKSEDGSLVISDETMQISDGKKVRVQIGKDASGDYSISVWDQNGNLMFSKGGITDSAIKDAIIRNDMVSDTANIAAHKLDIDSLFEEINGSTNTIKSTQVYIDDKGQTLNLAFKTLSDAVTSQGNTLTSQGTQISAIQGQITSKIWQQDINKSLDTLEVGGRNLYIVKNSEEGFLIVGGTSLATMNLIRKEHTSEFIAVTEGEHYIFQVWCTIDEADTEDPNLWMAYDLFDADKNVITNRPAKRNSNKLPNGQSYDIYEITIPANAAYIRVSARLYSDGLIKLEKGTIPTEWTPAPEDIDGNISTLTTKYSSIEQSINSISATVAEHDSAVNTITDKVTTVEQDLDGFKTSVSQNYITNNDFNSRMSSAETSITQNSNAIVACATKKEVADLTIGGRNLYIAKDAVDGYLSSSGDGSLTVASSVTKEKTSDFISVSPGESIQYQVWVTTPASSYIWYAYQFFKADKTALDTNRPSWHLYETTNGFYHATCNAITVPAGAAYIRVSARLFEDGKIKVERGTKPTDWSPAPEDTSSDINQLDSRMTQVELAADGLTATISGLEIGGRNLYVESASFNSDKWINTASWKKDGVDSLGNARIKCGAWAGLYQFIKVKAGEVYTLSANVLGDGTSDIRFYANTYDTASEDGNVVTGVTPTNTKVGTAPLSEKRFYQTFTITADGYLRLRIENSISNSYIWVSSLKLERGNKPTDWTPAPSDIDADISDAAKTATNYLNYSTSGLVVGDMTSSTLGQNVRISSSTVDIRNNTTTLASFGANTIYLGKNSETAVINLCNGSATMRSIDDENFKIYTDKRLVMSAYRSMLLDCWRDSTHMTRVSLQSSDPDDTAFWGGISCTIYQDTVENTFDMSNNTTEFKIIKGTTEASFDLNETRLRIKGNNAQVNCTNGLYVGYDGSYAAKITLGYKMLQDKSIRWYWSDNALHDAFSNSNGQITYVGPGDIDETTTTMIRGKYVRLYAHNGGAVYLGYSGSTAVTSDRNLKNDILDIDDKYMDFFDRLRPITYKYNVGHRDHVGFVAQEVEEALIASGLTTEQFAGLVIEKDVTLNPNYDSGLSDEEKAANENHYDTLYSLRYEEFISLLVKKVQSLQEQINQLRTNV